MKTHIYECDSCGLCCSKLIVEAEPVDVLREPRIVETQILDGNGKLTVLQSSWSLACVDPCKFLGADKRCGIYPTRPNVCVSFQAGSEKCQSLRVENGLAALELVGVETNVLSRLKAEIAECGDDE